MNVQDLSLVDIKDLINELRVRCPEGFVLGYYQDPEEKEDWCLAFEGEFKSCLTLAKYLEWELQDKWREMNK